MIKTVIPIDLHKDPSEQPFPLHNRWHPDIPSVATVKPGDTFRVECMDWTGGQIHNNDTANDVQTVDLRKVHYLSGPIAVEGAEPGDLLVVDILDINAFDRSPWGFTGIFSRENGGGFLTEKFPNAAKAIWDFNGIYASSRHIPHVRFPGIMHPGLIGTAPSHALLAEWNKREGELFAQDPHRVPPLTYLPNPEGALCGSSSEKNRIAREAARTVPGRENGGNCDIKNLTRGSRAFFPVFVKNAHLSVGDLHFSQGDGEISFCGGIEMAGSICLKVDIIKGGMHLHKVHSPIFLTGPLQPMFDEYLVFEGISVTETGKQLYLDTTAAYKNACLHAIAYLETCGYSPEQAYILLSAAPIEGRISGIVDIPNALCSLYIPTRIFDFDIQPHKKIRSLNRTDLPPLSQKKI